jgi:hypothetical protein
MTSMGADGRRLVSGDGACGSGKTRGRRGIAVSPHVEASAGERVAGKWTAAEIDAGGRNSRSAAAGSIEGSRDPADLNRCTCEPRARRRSEGEGLGSFTDGEGARAAAMARRPVLQAVARAARHEKAWKLGCRRRGVR